MLRCQSHLPSQPAQPNLVVVPQRTHLLAHPSESQANPIVLHLTPLPRAERCSLFRACAGEAEHKGPFLAPAMSISQRHTGPDLPQGYRPPSAGRWEHQHTKSVISCYRNALQITVRLPRVLAISSQPNGPEGETPLEDLEPFSE